MAKGYIITVTDICNHQNCVIFTLFTTVAADWRPMVYDKLGRVCQMWLWWKDVSGMLFIWIKQPDYIFYLYKI